MHDNVIYNIITIKINAHINHTFHEGGVEPLYTPLNMYLYLLLYYYIIINFL